MASRSIPHERHWEIQIAAPQSWHLLRNEVFFPEGQQSSLLLRVLHQLQQPQWRPLLLQRQPDNRPHRDGPPYVCATLALTSMSRCQAASGREKFLHPWKRQTLFYADSPSFWELDSMYISVKRRKYLSINAYINFMFANCKHVKRIIW